MPEPQRLDLLYTLTGTVSLPPGSQLITDDLGHITEVRLPNGVLLSLFSQVFARRSSEDDGQLLSNVQAEALDCLVDDVHQDLATRMTAPAFAVQALPDLPPGPPLSSLTTTS
jgi:hypothetical protein